MRNVPALTQRELAANFLSPIAYIVAAVFLVAIGYLFTTFTFVEGNEASLREMMEQMAKILAFAIPLLTMRVLSEEYASGTIESLMTAPVTDVEVILGKFLGVFIFYLALLAVTFIHAFILSRHGDLDINVMLYGYAGMVLLGALYVAVGVFASGLTQHQLVAALIAASILSIFTIAVDALALWRGGNWRTWLAYVNILQQFKDFSKGLFDTKSLVFFLSGIGFFGFLAIKVLESRRWR